MQSSQRIAFVIVGFGLFLIMAAVERADVHAQQGEGGGRQIEVWVPPR